MSCTGWRADSHPLCDLQTLVFGFSKDNQGTALLEVHLRIYCLPCMVAAVFTEADTVYSPTSQWVSGTVQEYKFSFGYDNNGVVSMKLNTETVAKVNLVGTGLRETYHTSSQKN